MNAKIIDWSVEEYNADTTRLRSSHLRTILEPQGPRAFYLKHVAPQPPDDEPESSRVDDLELGNLLHDLALRGRKGWVTSDLNKNSREFKTFRAANEGKSILSAKQERTILRWYNAIERNHEAKRIIEAGYPELTGHLDYEVELDDGTVETILCKCRWDIFCGSTGADWDLKTTRATDKKSFERQASDLGYHVQAGFYDLHKEALGIHFAPHHYIAVLKADPSYCYVWPAGHQLLQLGRDMAMEALKRVAKCRVAQRNMLADKPEADPIEAWPDYLELNQNDGLEPDPLAVTRAGFVSGEEGGWGA